MFKAQYYVRRIEERSDSSEDDSGAEDKEQDQEAGRPKRGGILRNYTVNKPQRAQDKGKHKAKENDQENGKGDDTENEKEVKAEKDIQDVSKGASATTESGKASEAGAKSDTRSASGKSSASSATSKKSASKFRKVIKKVTVVNRVGGGDCGEKPPSARGSGLSARSKNSSAGRLKSPVLPRISSGSARAGSAVSMGSSGGGARRNSGGSNK